MKLTTNKGLIVFYDKFNGLYRFCGIRYFKGGYDDEHSTPILYTNSFWVARNTTLKLNKGLRA